VSSKWSAWVFPQCHLVKLSKKAWRQTWQQLEPTEKTGSLFRC